MRKHIIILFILLFPLFLQAQNYPTLDDVKSKWTKIEDYAQKSDLIQTIAKEQQIKPTIALTAMWASILEFEDFLKSAGIDLPGDTPIQEISKVAQEKWSNNAWKIAELQEQIYELSKPKFEMMGLDDALRDQIKMYDHPFNSIRMQTDLTDGVTLEDIEETKKYIETKKKPLLEQFSKNEGEIAKLESQIKVLEKENTKLAKLRLLNMDWRALEMHRTAYTGDAPRMSRLRYEHINSVKELEKTESNTRQILSSSKNFQERCKARVALSTAKMKEKLIGEAQHTYRAKVYGKIKSVFLPNGALKFAKSGNLFLIALITGSSLYIANNEIEKNGIDRENKYNNIKNILEMNQSDILGVLANLDGKDQEIAFRVVAEKYYNLFDEQAENLMSESNTKRINSLFSNI